jgi:hypothetical protein
MYPGAAVHRRLDMTRKRAADETLCSKVLEDERLRPAGLAGNGRVGGAVGLFLVTHLTSPRHQTDGRYVETTHHTPHPDGGLTQRLSIPRATKAIQQPATSHSRGRRCCHHMSRHPGPFGCGSCALPNPAVCNGPP